MLVKKINGGDKYESKYQSPVYDVKRINIVDIAAQKTNPNSMNNKSFAALQTSIFNSGYVFPILISANKDYNKESEVLIKSDIDRLNLVLTGSSKDFKSGGKNLEFATETSDLSIAKYFKYRVVDGQQRSSVIRLGTKYFLEDGVSDKLISDWQKGKNIPKDPGKMMLKYIAWRENFSIPAVLLTGLSNAESLSTTVLLNQAKGSHRFDSIKEVVYDLINIEGKSPEWISKNMFLDIESVKRISQLSGLKSVFDDAENIDLSWNPEGSKSFKAKNNYYLTREAKIFLEDFYPEDEIKKMKDPKKVAESKGWDRKLAQNGAKQEKMELMPNGSRKFSSIHNYFEIKEDGKNG